MSIPVVKEIIGGYLFAFEAEKISIRVTRLRVHASDSRVTGELQILNAVTNKPIYPQTALNFTSERTRTQLTKTLTELDNRFDWSALLNSLSTQVIDLARAGEPVRELWTNAEGIKPPEPLLFPILYRNLPTVIFGEKEAAKSTLALFFYFCLVLPWPDNPLELIAPERSVKTLILDWEAEGEILQYYGKKIQDAHNLPPIPVLHRRCFIPLADDIEQIQEWIGKLGAEVIIIDSLGAACGGELNKAEPALRFFSALRELKAGSLIIAQNAKDPETKRKSIFGSVYFQYYSRSIWEQVRAEGSDEDCFDIALFHRAANISKHEKPMCFQLHYNDTGLTIARQPFDTSEFMAKVSNSSKVLAVLKNGALSVDEIANACDLGRGATQVILSRLKARDKVVPTEGKGMWGLRANVE